MSGRSATLPLLRRDGDVPDLTDFLLRALSEFFPDDGGQATPAHLGQLPLPLLALSNNMPDSSRFGAVLLTAEAFSEHAKSVLCEEAGADSVVLAFSLTSRLVDEEKCGVRRCRDGLKRTSQLRENRKGYHFRYPVAFMIGDGGLASFSMSMGKAVSFPEFTGMSVNMMPFVLGDKASLPGYLHSYWPLIEACQLEKSNKQEIGKIGYLTVDEKEIQEDQTAHRRAGLHTDSAGVHIPGLRPRTPAPRVYHSEAEESYDVYRRGDLKDNPGRAVYGRGESMASLAEFNARGLGETTIRYHSWGIGMVIDGERRGGIYMASTADDSCEIFNAIVDDPRMIGHLGSCEHLRGFLGPGTKLKANELCWFTDRTPHESLPLPAGTKRQFFRLVTSQVDAWFQDHSTTNPMGVKPGDGTTIITGSKFKRRG